MAAGIASGAMAQLLMTADTSGHYEVEACNRKNGIMNAAYISVELPLISEINGRRGDHACGHEFQIIFGLAVVVPAETGQTLIDHEVLIQLNGDRLLLLIELQTKAIGEMQIEEMLVLASNSQTRGITGQIVDFRADDFQGFARDDRGQLLRVEEGMSIELRANGHRYFLAVGFRCCAIDEFNIDLPCGRTNQFVRATRRGKMRICDCSQRTDYLPGNR